MNPVETGFGIWVVVDGEAKELGPGSFGTVRRETRGEIVSTRYGDCREPGLRLDAAVEARGDDLTLAVETPASVRVERIQFPQVTVPDARSYDELLMPGGYGDAIVDPIKSIQLYGRRQRRPPPKGLTFVDNTTDEIIYNCPATAGLQYMVLHNAARSVYVACYAMGPDNIAFRARAAGGQKLVLSVEHYPDTIEGRWRSPVCDVAALEGGWHAGADRYRRRMAPLLSPPVLPEWIACGRFHGWIQVPMQIEGAPPQTRFCDIPDAMRKALDLGHDVIHLYGWMDRGHDTMYPDYAIDPELGTAAELRKALDEVRRLGGRAILYTNGKLIDVQSRFHQAHGCECCVKDAKGEPWRENYGTRAEFHIACPGSPRWREHFVGVVRRMVGEYGAHGIQIDQVASTWLQPCWRTDHEHKGSHDNAVTGMETMLREIRDTCRAIDPDFFVWAEGCQDRLGQYFDIHQGSYSEGPVTAFSVTVGRRFPEQFRYTWPRAIVMGGVNDIDSLCHTFAQGKPFDCSMAPFADRDFASLHRALLDIRRSKPEYFHHGVYLDTGGIALAGPGHVHVLANGQGRLAVIRAPGAGPGQRRQALLHLDAPCRSVRPIHPTSCRVTASEMLCVGFSGPVAVFEMQV